MKRGAGWVVLAGLFAASGVGAQPQRISLPLGEGVAPLEMVLVRAGTATLGSPPSERGRQPDETPHAVTLTEDYYLGETVVLRGQFAAFVAATGYRTEAEVGTSGGSGWDGHRLVQQPSFTWRSPGFAQGDDHPVVLVTAADAERFVAWAGQRTGRSLRLPTEAEWEFACRAGEAASSPDAHRAEDLSALRQGGPHGTAPARGAPARGGGFFDLLGHVQQWTRDVYGPYPEGAGSDPLGTAPPAGEPARRALRGGSWLRSLDAARCAARARNTPGSRNADNGFRVALTAREAPVAPMPPAQEPPPLQQPVPYEPPPAPRVEPSSGWLGYSAALVAGGGLLFYFATRRRRGFMVSTRTGSHRVLVDLADDGFRVQGDPSLNGTRLVARHPNVRSQPQSRFVFAHSPAGMFVYTGERPLVTDVAAETSGGAVGAAGPATANVHPGHRPQGSHAQHGGGWHGAHGVHGVHDHGASHDHGGAHEHSAWHHEPPAY